MSLSLNVVGRPGSCRGVEKGADSGLLEAGPAGLAGGLDVGCDRMRGVPGPCNGWACQHPRLGRLGVGWAWGGVFRVSVLETLIIRRPHGAVK